ncbi:hypothetical protein CQW23_27805 [Capsicum baccatum]|uniref:F-box domain-containing protein n=1 Tax=Capsicum baccatum TaxID=33114 RepID=A0A2G2VEU5_CAPBA|nr:hypothetical protein CQW23_27805 [Capsicum baccatum]
MEKEKNEEVDEKSSCISLLMLPEGCIVDILDLTSLRDVCHLSLVSTFLRCVADSDSVWANFLPSDYRSIIARSLTPIPEFRSLKDIYVYLSHNHVLIDEGHKGLSEATSLSYVRKKCMYRILQRRTYDLQMTEAPPSAYALYFVYKLNEDYYSGFDPRDVEVSVGISSVESKNMQIVCLTMCDSPYNPPSPYLTDDWPDDGPLPELRDDGWFELEIGEILLKMKMIA